MSTGTVCRGVRLNSIGVLGSQQLDAFMEI